jgi:hypothetical protein
MNEAIAIKHTYFKSLFPVFINHVFGIAKSFDSRFLFLACGMNLSVS